MYIIRDLLEEYRFRKLIVEKWPSPSYSSSITSVEMKNKKRTMTLQEKQLTTS